jgi:hypothetical protein
LARVLCNGAKRLQFELTIKVVAWRKVSEECASQLNNNANSSEELLVAATLDNQEFAGPHLASIEY